MIFVVLTAAGVALPALAQPSFTGTGDLPGGRVFSECLALSRDGSVAFGDSATQNYDPITAITSACRYADGSLQWLDYSYPNISTFAYAANQDGTVVAGYAIIVPPYADIEIFRWTASGGMQILGDIAGGATNSTARGISADGNIIVGFGSSAASTAGCGICQEAFKWTADTGIVGLGDLPGGNLDSRANAISGNGHVIVGAGTSVLGTTPTMWDDTGVHNLGYLPQGGFAAQGVCNAVNYDGSVIVGTSSSVNSTTEAFRWTASGNGGGVMIGLGDLPGGPFQSQAWAVSDDGQIVVGQATTEGGIFGAGQSTAFIWDEAHGIRDLKLVLMGAGLNISGWMLTSARAISADGVVIAGIGINPNGDGEGWIARLPRPPHCGSADFNCDGDVATDADIEAFFACLAGTCPSPPCTSTADFNGDGDAATDADIEAFFRVLAGGSC
jgi:probable HAF family extracellular repeat protein